MSARITNMLQAAGDPITNTTTETSFAKKTFAANELTPGKVYDIEAILRVTAQNSTDTIAVGVRFGTNSSTPGSNTACGASSAIDAAVSDMSSVRIRLHVHSTTRAVMSIMMPDPDAEGQGVEAYTEILTIAPDTAYYLDVTGTWSVANAGNSAQAEAFTCIEIV